MPVEGMAAGVKLTMLGRQRAGGSKPHFLRIATFMNLNTQTKKHLGQHWLFDEMALEAMIKSAEVSSEDYVVEIGPGLGTLTQHLIATGANVLSLEYDESLIPGLRTKFNKDKNFEIRHADILQFDFSQLPKNYKVVANIPYYLTSNLLRRMCEAENHFSNSALLVQKEVAERVCSKPGDMSLLSISVQFYCEVSLGDLVPASLFTPAPKVDSQILILKFRSRPLYESVDTKKFFRIVKAGFSERRKKLRSSLSGGLSISKTDTEELLLSCQIDPNLRAQALSIDDWYRLYLKLNP